MATRQRIEPRSSDVMRQVGIRIPADVSSLAKAEAAAALSSAI
jgi:hypothetical protein